MCASCQIALPDPAAPEPPTQDRTCPRCLTAPLAPVPIEDGAGSVCHVCQHCRGLFVTARSWCAFIARPELATALETRLPPHVAQPAELLAMLSCPICKRQMERGRFAASSSVVVDVCTMHGMWLDAGELGDVTKHGRDRAVAAKAPSDVAAYNEAMRYHLTTLGHETRMAVQASMAASGHAVAQSPGRGMSLPLIIFLVVSVLGALAGFKALRSSREQINDATKAATSAQERLEP
jgi:Zn-finger nucleic acid-binding protein